MMENSQIIDINRAKNENWDVIIIGSGMGGCSAAYQLAHHGRKVLILEKGLATFSQYKGVEASEEDPDERLNCGHWPTQLTAVVDKKRSNIWAPLGCGAGGSSLLYAAALQRLESIDFAEQKLPQGTTIEWPFSYQELAPYYEQAEKLFFVCGANDPLSTAESQSLRQPPAMCEADQHFFRQFQLAGLHPYRLHAGIKYEDSCKECGGHICPINCKLDANNACLQPAFKTGNVFFVGQVEVQGLSADKIQVNGVTLKDNTGCLHELSARIFIAAAGAFFTPVILQNSKNSDWPDGLANKSGMVGRNLMFHESSFIAFWPKGKFSRAGANKTIALRDYYSIDGKKYGEFQSTGILASYGSFLYALRMLFDQSMLRRFKLLRQFLRIPAYIAAKLYGDATVFATIVEDYPYWENRIVADKSTASGMRFEYHIHQELKDRARGFEDAICKRIATLKKLPMSPVSLNYGHPCGTCKAGNDPENSVVDRNCKTHDLENLYVADATFMPTSGGTNPSLTIAANALRVADKVNEQLQTQK
jgi:choline dehydrogenase-like flavoprotein